MPRSLLALLFSLGAMTATADAQSIYWGGHVEASTYGLPFEDPRAWDRFEATAGKRASILTLGRWWYQNGQPQPFPRDKAEQVRLRGSIPMITWAPRAQSGTTDPNFRSSVITSGRYDPFIAQWARDVKAWNHPLFLRFAWEMDGNWYPWAEGRLPDGTVTNGNRPGDYVRMWRHVHAIFDSVGVTNVTWVWAVNHETTSSAYPPLSQLYPGNDVVDWTGMDPYNRYDGWLTFAQTITGENTGWLANTFDRIKAVAPGKPMMLAEFGSKEDPRRPAWIRDALDVQIPNRTLIKAILWFNAEDTILETGQDSVTAFRASIANPRYKANVYRDLAPAKIGPAR